MQTASRRGYPRSTWPKIQEWSAASSICAGKSTPASGSFPWFSASAVSFSVTMVALTLTSGQYGPKVIRHFLEDNRSKVSLGLFLGAYVYALLVLTGYRTQISHTWTVMTALLLALLAVIGFINFIHRTATDLQADEIVQRIGKGL